MTIIAVQYLENAPGNATPARVRARLRQAFETLPISMVLLGWNLPPRLEEAAAGESARHGAKLYRWHPLLASDAGFSLPREWQTLNLQKQPVPGFKGLPEFTFICPNRADVRDWIAERIEAATQRGFYQGLFFDRMRFPSPAENPKTHLACFCKHCQRVAADSGLDLEDVRRYLNGVLADKDATQHFVQDLFGSSNQPPNPLQRFLDFRAHTITRLIRSAVQQVRSAGLSVGLDCFSPALTRMVGQDLGELTKFCDWIKIMTYPRVFGPAGLPFEILGIADWLIKRGISELKAMQLIEKAGEISIPSETTELRETGLGSNSLRREIDRGHDAGVTNLLAGLALVEMEGVHRSTAEQINSDLDACHAADGLVLSWDLWHIPPERLIQLRDYIDSIN